MAVAVHQRLVGDGAERQTQAAGFGLADQKFLEQKCMRADAFRGIVIAQRQQFVAQRQQAARLKADDRHAARGERRIGCNQPIEFGAGVVHKSRGEKGAAAAQRTFCIGRVRQMHAITAFDQHAQRGVEVFALIGAIESVGEQHHFAAVSRAERFAGRRKHIAPPLRQIALRADAGKFFKQLSQQRAPVAQIGQWREARRQRRVMRQIADQPVAQRQPVFRPARPAPRSSSSPCRRRSGIRAAGLAGNAKL